MQQNSIAAAARRRAAKGDNKRLRKNGKVPAVVYGGEAQPVCVALDDHDLEVLLHGASRSNALFNLALENGGGQEQTVIRDIQRHPVTSRLIHVDFLRVDLEKTITMEVPVHATGGTPKGAREGGVLDHVNRSVEVRCKPLDLPRSFDADISNLDINQTFFVRDLVVPANVEILSEPETPLFVVLLPRKAEEETPAEGVVAGAAEPVVIGEKKKDEEQEEKAK